MNKTVLDVGNCSPDHAAIRRMLESQFGAEVLQAHGLADTEQLLASKTIDLVLVNRKLDQDYSDGIEIIKRIKANPNFASLPIMLVTNYEDSQLQAIELGALRGFGKLALDAAETRSRIANVLVAKTVQPV